MGTSSKTRSSTSALGSFSRTTPALASSRRRSPACRAAAEVGGQFDHPLLVRPQRHHDARLVQAVLQADDLALRVAAAQVHDVQRLVQDDLAAAAQRRRVDAGSDVHLELAPAGPHVHRVVRMDLEDRPVAGRRGRQLVHLGAERRDLILRLAERPRPAARSAAARGPTAPETGSACCAGTRTPAASAPAADAGGTSLPPAP